MSITREQAAEIKARAYEHAHAFREEGPRQWHETWDRLTDYLDSLVSAPATPPNGYAGVYFDMADPGGPKG